MITRLEARTNCAAYTKGCKSLYIRINYWWVEPEPQSGGESRSEGGGSWRVAVR